MHRMLVDPRFREDERKMPFFDTLASRNPFASGVYGLPLPAFAGTSFARVTGMSYLSLPASAGMTELIRFAIAAISHPKSRLREDSWGRYQGSSIRGQAPFTNSAIQSRG